MDRPPAALQLAGRALRSPPQGRTGAPSSFDPSATDHAIAAATAAKSPHAKEYGSAFAEGFSRFLRTGDLADVTVEVVTDVDAQGAAPPSLPPPSVSISPQPRAEPAAGISPASASPSAAGAAAALVAAAPPACSSLGEYRLHGLLLARHSAFFAAALGQVYFADSAARRIRLTLDSAAAPAWPALVDYFYLDRVRLDDSNALPLLALARQLLVPELDAYCMDYVCGRLCAANCLEHMRAAVRFSLHDLHGECVELAAQGFPLLYCGDLGGLPSASLLEILTHPLLQVHCELQVVEAVTGYLSTTAVDPGAQRALCAQIRFPYLDNATITRLAVQPTAVLAAAVIGGRPAAAHPMAAEAADGGAAISFKAPDAPPAAPEGASDAAAAAPPPAGSSVTVTQGSAVAEAAGQPATGGPGSGEGAVAGSSTTAINAPTGQQPKEAAAAGGSSSRQAAPAGAVPGDGAAAATTAAAANGGGANGDAAATTAAATAAAATDGEGGADSGLLSPNSSACSSPRSSAGGGSSSSSSSLVKPHSQPNARPHRRRSKSGQTDGGDGGASGVPPPAPNPHPPHHPHGPPLLPRDLVLEGALSRLAAMEFHSSLPPPSQLTSAVGTSAGEHVPSSAAGGSGTSPPGHQALHPYLHPYQPYQFQYQYGPGAANGGGDAAAAANGGRRPLAVFRVQGAPQTQPPPPPPPPAPALVPHQQQLAAAAPPPPGGGGGGPHAHSLAHGLYYNHPAAAAAGPPLPHYRQQHQQQYHLIHPAARGFMYGSGPGGGGGGGSLVDGAAGQQLGATGGGGGGVVMASSVAAGVAMMDMAAAFAAFCLPPPRLSYCCNLVHGLPGGCAWVDVALEALWEHLVPYITVQVSGCSEGSPRHVLSNDPDCFFETNDSADPLPWFEVQLPHNVHVLQMHRYTFLHGHRRAGYYRARNFKTQIAVRPAGEVHAPEAAAPGSPPGGGGAAAGAGPAAAATAAAAGQRPRGQQGQQGGTAWAATLGAATCRYVDLTTRMAEQFDVGVLAGTTGLGPWRVLRLQATGAQEDGVHRLCVRGLRMYGIARVDLMQQAHGGFVVQPQWVLNARLDQGGSSGGAPGGAGAGGGAAAGGGGFGFGGGGGPAMGAGAGGGGFSAGVLHQWIGGHQGA